MKGLKFMFDGKHWIVFPDKVQFEVQKEIWDRLKGLVEAQSAKEAELVLR